MTFQPCSQYCIIAPTLIAGQKTVKKSQAYNRQRGNARNCSLEVLGMHSWEGPSTPHPNYVYPKPTNHNFMHIGGGREVLGIHSWEGSSPPPFPFPNYVCPKPPNHNFVHIGGEVLGIHSWPGLYCGCGPGVLPGNIYMDKYVYI